MIEHSRDKIAERLHAIQADLPASVILIAASKQQSVETILMAVDAGLKQFGENYLQEAIAKITALQEQALQWHFIGHVQSNKTALIAKYFDWVQTVDSLKIARRLSAARPSEKGELNVCIQVNMSLDPVKSGVLPEDVFALSKAIQTLPNVRLRGLMLLPNEQDTSRAFVAMKQCYDEYATMFQWNTLSMGMSADFKEAIEKGSTMVRLGQILFGERGVV